MFHKFQFSIEHQNFLVSLDCLTNFVNELSHFMTPVQDSNSRVVQTIYLGDEDKSLPWGVSIQLSRVLDRFSSEILLTEKDLFCTKIEAFDDIDPHVTFCETLSLADALKLANGPISLSEKYSLRPYIVAEYKMDKFVSTPENLQAVIYTDIRYGFLDKSQKTIWIGQDNFARIEFTFSRMLLKANNYHLNLIETLLNHYYAIPVVSIREQAYSYAARYIDQLIELNHEFYNELPHCEIESKFMFHHDNPAGILFALKEYLKDNDTFFLPSHYPFTQETASIDHYWLQNNKEGGISVGLKIISMGQLLKPVLKSKARSEKFDELFIIKRDESKEPCFSYSPTNLMNYLKSANVYNKMQYVGCLKHLRRAFWPQNKISGRVFHISMDVVYTSSHRSMWQLEIEYSGRNKQHSTKLIDEFTVNQIYNELELLRKEVIFFYSQNGVYLEPTSMTKFDWLLTQIKHDSKKS